MTSSYLTVFLWAAGMLLAASIAVRLIIKLTSRRFRRSVRTIIFELDTLANRMGSERKHRIAIHSINEILGWQRMLVPAIAAGWIIDSEVAAVRKRQSGDRYGRHTKRGQTSRNMVAQSIIGRENSHVN